MFSFGVVLGIAGAIAALYFVPAVDQGRERSIVSVQPNGGKVETFHVNLPADRIFAGRAGAETTFPEGVDWPELLNTENSQLELFKVRNAEERVIALRHALRSAVHKMSSSGRSSSRARYALRCAQRDTLCCR